jgi:hypothetical protein
MSDITRDSIIDSIKALPVADQWAVMESALKALKNASKPSKVKKVRDPNAPKKEATWWVKRTCEVRDHLKEVISEENSSRKSRGEKALPAVVAVRVTSMLRDAGKLTQDVMPSRDDILATWATFLSSPPDTKPKPVKKSDSSEPKPVKEPKVKKVLTDDEKAAKKAAAAAKKAEKKAAAVASPPPAVAEPVADEPEAEVTPYEWTFDFGKGATVYERLDHDGKAYIYDNDTKAYLGLFMEKLKKLNKSVADPLA